MEIKPAGLTGLLCVLGKTADDATAAKVAALDRAIAARKLTGVVETVPGFASLLVRYDPLRISEGRLRRVVERLAETLDAAASAPARVVEIPVCYGGEFGPDLPFVAAHAGLTEAEVVRIHSQAAYPIRMIGFLPGFPYLGGLDARLHTPRLDTPRAAIPAGSVGIGGAQTGVYPLESPGGWRLIGRTPLRLFAPGKEPLYSAGDAIRFTPIGPEKFREREAAAWASR